MKMLINTVDSNSIDIEPTYPRSDVLVEQIVLAYLTAVTVSRNSANNLSTVASGRLRANHLSREAIVTRLHK